MLCSQLTGTMFGCGLGGLCLIGNSSNASQSTKMRKCKNAGIATTTFPTAINLRVIELYELSFSCGEKLAFVLQLLQHSPNLCELKITASDNTVGGSKQLQAGSEDS
ncbi:PREDICTED: uncharacterized protein LOC109149892 [Ipomoea nil]|uniref:uncharacterized protein LOC109149892 n=1 Tax=Ipomoea nil TaxID=35883 RepID=UPI000900985E|nr:PREDICTED: uncharacterized protein LOC109149892 [Ipomoea nil]